MIKHESNRYQDKADIYLYKLNCEKLLNRNNISMNNCKRCVQSNFDNMKCLKFLLNRQYSLYIL